jgi:hypothetical protein
MRRPGPAGRSARLHGGGPAVTLSTISPSPARPPLTPQMLGPQVPVPTAPCAAVARIRIPARSRVAAPAEAARAATPAASQPRAGPRRATAGRRTPTGSAGRPTRHHQSERDAREGKRGRHRDHVRRRQKARPWRPRPTRPARPTRPPPRVGGMLHRLSSPPSLPTGQERYSEPRRMQRAGCAASPIASKHSLEPSPSRAPPAAPPRFAPASRP